MLEFADLGFEVYNLQLDGLVSLADGDTPEQKNVLLQLYVAATDQASSASRQSWGWEAAPASARSLVRSLDLSGRADTLTLTVAGYKGEYRSYPLNAQLTTVCANVRRPLDFSLLRFAAVFALALAVFALRPASVLWRDSYCAHEKKIPPGYAGSGACALRGSVFGTVRGPLQCGCCNGLLQYAGLVGDEPHRLYHAHQ